MLKLMHKGFLSFANILYPQLYSLNMEIYEQTIVPGDIIEGNDDILESVVIPKNLPLTFSSIQKDGVYLVWND